MVEKFTYKYDSKGNLISKIFENWEEGLVVVKYKILLTYNLYNHLIYAKGEEWENGNWESANICNPISFMDSFGNEFYYGSCGWGVEEWSEIYVYYSTLTSVTKNNNYPTKYSLSQNYPNPFNSSTIIKYTIPKNDKRETKDGKTFIRLNVFDVLGREVATLVNEKQKPGNYEVEFDGSKLTSGVYFYRLQTRNYTSTKKMILLR
jgi:hypothetical protein